MAEAEAEAFCFLFLDNEEHRQCKSPPATFDIAAIKDERTACFGDISQQLRFNSDEAMVHTSNDQVKAQKKPMTAPPMAPVVSYNHTRLFVITSPSVRVRGPTQT